jgi:hypothetical protein
MRQQWRIALTGGAERLPREGIAIDFDAGVEGEEHEA